MTKMKSVNEKRQPKILDPPESDIIPSRFTTNPEVTLVDNEEKVPNELCL